MLFIWEIDSNVVTLLLNKKNYAEKSHTRRGSRNQ